MWRGLLLEGHYTKYDEHAVQQINRNMELIRYRRFGKNLLMLELTNRTLAQGSPPTGDAKTSPASKTVEQSINDLDPVLRDVYDQLKAHLEALGDDVQVDVQKYHVAFKRPQNFACVEAKTTKGCLTVFIKVRPDDVELEAGFTRDVRKVGHYGTGDLEITLRTLDD